MLAGAALLLLGSAAALLLQSSAAAMLLVRSPWVWFLCGWAGGAALLLVGSAVGAALLLVGSAESDIVGWLGLKIPFQWAKVQRV